jgi:hypothetical protein
VVRDTTLRWPVRVIENATAADAESAVIMGAARLGSAGSFQVHHAARPFVMEHRTAD